MLGTWGIGRIARLDPRLLRVALVFGLLPGAVYVTEIVLEYVWLPRYNTSYGLVEFSLVFLLYLLAGLSAAYQTRRARDGDLAAVGAAMVSTRLW